MTGIDLLGFAAGTSTTCAFWPQRQRRGPRSLRALYRWGCCHIFSRRLPLVAVWTGPRCLADHLTNFITLLPTGAILLLKVR